jgi:hypothetical protein
VFWGHEPTEEEDKKIKINEKQGAWSKGAYFISE